MTGPHGPQQPDRNAALSAEDRDAVDLVRRRLIAAGLKYVAPAIVVTLSLEGTVYAQASCKPATCKPAGFCKPSRPCKPDRR